MIGVRKRALSLNSHMLGGPSYKQLHERALKFSLIVLNFVEERETAEQKVLHLTKLNLNLSSFFIPLCHYIHMLPLDLENYNTDQIKARVSHNNSENYNPMHFSTLQTCVVFN